MWRCFCQGLPECPEASICSTHVEMFLMFHIRLGQRRNLLHACGDVSHWDFFIRSRARSAPRMWRCFRKSMPTSRKSSICSTHVEMFPNIYKIFDTVADLLHACGDVSIVVNDFPSCPESAPRMWRCFSDRTPLSPSSVHLLHTCGDVSRLPR